MDAAPIMSGPSFARYQLFHPLRALDWRWQRARHLVATRRRLSPQDDDPETIAAARYLRAVSCRTDGDRDRLAQDWPAIYAAQQFSRIDGRARWEAEARILAGQSDAEVAACCGLGAEAIRWFEALYFNVRDCLQAHDWITIHVLGPDLRHGIRKDDIGRIWKAFAYFGGAQAMEIAKAVMAGQPLPEYVPPADADRLRHRFEMAIAAVTCRTLADYEDLLAAGDAFRDRYRDPASGADPLPDKYADVRRLFVRMLSRADASSKEAVVTPYHAPQKDRRDSTDGADQPVATIDVPGPRGGST